MRSVPLFAAVDGEGDALGEEGEIDGLLAAAQLVSRQGGERLSQRAVLRAQFAVGRAHFVKGMVERVVPEERLQLDLMAGGHESGLSEFRSNLRGCG